jgi:lipopolysaccharide biosynthesis glycosyltransferase
MELKTKINICLSCDNNYAKHAGVVIASILFNSSDSDELTFFILDGGINETNISKLKQLSSIKKCTINFIKINRDLFKEYENVKTHSYVTIATYYRLKLPSLLPNVDKILYLDCDFVINSSLQDLFNTNMEEYPIAGVLDIKRSKVCQNSTYINAGMLVFDINKMKELDLETKFYEWTKKNIDKITCGDQEIINEVCKGQIKILDNEWNVQSSNFTNRSSYIQNPKGIHFISKKKPWNFASYSYHKSYYFKYLQLTPWALKGLKLFVWTNLNQIASLLCYIIYRPLFILRPKFYQALYYTYIKPIKGGGH